VIHSIQEEIASMDDEKLFDFLATTLTSLMETKIHADFNEYAEAIKTLPECFRAMASIYELDVNITLNRLDSYFCNTYSWELCNETLKGLKKLGAITEANIFEESMTIIKRHWLKIGLILKMDDEILGDYLDEYWESSGLEEQFDELDKRMRNCIDDKINGLLSYWVQYTRDNIDEVTLASKA